MKFSEINKRIPEFIFYFLVFILLPFAHSYRLLDPELGLRYFFLSVFVFLYSVYFLLKKKQTITFSTQGITIAFIIYLAANAVSIFNSVNTGEAIAEFLRLLIFFFLYQYFFYIIRNQGSKLQEIIVFINASVLIFSAFGLWQFTPYIINYFEKGEPLAIRLDLASTLSNKNFYSETLLLSVPFILYGALFLEKNILMIISMVSGIIIFSTIIILQSVSVFLGAAASFIIILYFLLLDRNKTANRKKPGWYFAFIPLLVAAFFIYTKTTSFKELKVRVQTMERYITDPSTMNDVSLENNNSTYERIVLWRNSWRMIREHPILGSGLTNWAIYFPKYGVGSAPYMNSGMIRFERPHNDFLFMWCETGIIGFISYAAIFVISIIYCRKIFKYSTDAKTRWLAVLMLTGIVSFGVISCFGFPQQRPFSMIFLMAILAVIQSKYIDLENSKTLKSKIKSSQLFFISGIIISLSGLYVGTKRLTAEAHLSNALRAQVKKDWDRMARESNSAQSYYFPVDYTGTPVKWYMGFANFYAGNTEKGCTYFKEAEKVNPYHLEVLNDIGTCYDMNLDHDEARRYYMKALSSAALFPDALLNICVLYYNEGNIDSAYAVISRYKLKGSENYNRDLKVILHAKAFKIINQLNDTLLRSVLSKKIKDDKWLLSVHKEATETNQDFKDVLLMGN